MERLIVHTNVAAGNARIVGVEGGAIRIAPDLRDTEGPWFYWHIGVDACAGQRLRVLLEKPNCLTRRGAAVSHDGGWNWAWIPDYDPAKADFIYDCGANERAQFCLSVPYTCRNLDRWLEAHANARDLTRETLCRSRAGANVPLLRLGRLDGREQTQVLLTARHHCCEMMASYVLEGLMDGVLADDETGRALRERVQFLVVPMVDYDGCEAGDQGKNRAPHDHGADYGEVRLYPETAAIREWVETRLDHRVRLSLDLHCPWVRGEWNEHIYIVGSADPANAERQRVLAGRIERANAGAELPYGHNPIIPNGTAWNVRKPGATTRPIGRWMNECRPDATTATIEFPYADVCGVAVTAANARGFGRTLARAIVSHLDARDDTSPGVQ